MTRKADNMVSDIDLSGFIMPLGRHEQKDEDLRWLLRNLGLNEHNRAHPRFDAVQQEIKAELKARNT